jgi:DNA-binding GntR family transcriptional regulator
MRSRTTSEDGSVMTRADRIVYEKIKQAILENRLPPGTKLTEEKLSDLFDVSRERIRKVLQRLAYDRCVELKPHRGAFVASPGIEEAHDVFAARVLLETRMVDLVAAHADEEDYASLEGNIAREKAAHAQDRMNEAIALSGEFHVLLARASGNRVLAEILRDLVARSSLIIAMYGWRRFSLCAYKEHAVFLRLVRDGKLPQSRKSMVTHLRRLEEQLRFEVVPSRRADPAEVFGR